MSTIAEAFVRIRPNMAGFESEARTGVQSTFSKLAKVAGVAFGAGAVFKLGEDIVGHAADVQKQVEAIKTEFQGASKEVLQFSDHAAVGLGISAHLADQTSARFGILFKNLGIGPDLAAKMTVNFEKLAGSISQIRNVDPASVLANLPLAVAGNLRSLKQLGIAVDQNSLKIAAFKLGLTQSITQGLTPAQRAIAIYALATAHLGEFQKQAQSHSHDLANETRRLRAEWDNARDNLGKGLIPKISDLVAYLDKHLPNAVNKTKEAFKGIGAVVTSITKPVGGLKTAIEALLAAMVIGKIVGFANAIRTNLIKAGIEAYGAAAYKARTAYVGAMADSELATLGLAATIKGALITTGIGALVVAAGFAAQYIITHWSKVKGWFVDFTHFLPNAFSAAWTAVQGIVELAVANQLIVVELLAKGLSGALGWIPGIGPKIKAGLSVITDGIDHLRSDGISKLKKAGSEFADAWGTAFRKDVRANLAAVNKALDEWQKGTAASRKNALGDLAKQGFTTDLLSGKTIDTHGNVGLSAAAKKQNELLNLLQTQLVNTVKVQDAGITKIKEQLDTLGNNLKVAIDKENQDVKNALDQAKGNLASIGSAFNTAIDEVLDKPIQNAQDKISRLNNLKSLTDLTRSVLLPGGKQLSTNPQKALAELEAIQRQAGTSNKAAIQSFILQYRSAVLSVKQDQVNVTKQTTQQRIADLTDAFNRNQITLVQYKKRILGVLTADHVSYKKAGQLLGTAFANGFRDTVKGLFGQASAIAATPARFRGGTSGAEPSIIKPLDTLHNDQRAVEKIQQQIRDKHGALQTRIANNTKKTNDLLAKIHSVQLGATATSLLKNPGKTHKTAKRLSGTTG